MQVMMTRLFCPPSIWRLWTTTRKKVTLSKQEKIECFFFDFLLRFLRMQAPPSPKVKAAAFEIFCLVHPSHSVVLKIARKTQLQAVVAPSGFDRAMRGSNCSNKNPPSSVSISVKFGGFFLGKFVCLWMKLNYFLIANCFRIVIHFSRSFLLKIFYIFFFLSETTIIRDFLLGNNTGTELAPLFLLVNRFR